MTKPREAIGKIRLGGLYFRDFGISIHRGLSFRGVEG